MTNDSVRHSDRLLSALQRWMRARPLLYRLTLGTRVLLAVGFIPTGMVKLPGRRFTTMSPESDIGNFFDEPKPPRPCRRLKT